MLGSVSILDSSLILTVILSPFVSGLLIMAYGSGARFTATSDKPRCVNIPQQRLLPNAARMEEVR